MMLLVRRWFVQWGSALRKRGSRKEETGQGALGQWSGRAHRETRMAGAPETGAKGPFHVDVGLCTKLGRPDRQVEVAPAGAGHAEAQEVSLPAGYYRTVSSDHVG
jgi:hypothetical protein